MINVEWKGGMAFEANPSTGVKFSMGETADGTAVGPFPMEALLSAIAGCAGMDVISILEKKRQKVTSDRIEIDGTRPPKDEYPRPFLTLTMRHIVAGDNIDPTALARAIELSDEKYCSVLATLRVSPAMTSEFAIEQLSGTA